MDGLKIDYVDEGDSCAIMFFGKVHEYDCELNPFLSQSNLGSSRISNIPHTIIFLDMRKNYTTHMKKWTTPLVS